MQTNEASITAEWTALMRALGDLGITTTRAFSDPLAAKLLSGRTTAVYKVAQMLTGIGATPRLRRRFGPIMDTQTLRTLAIDDALAQCLTPRGAARLDQLVILGAGLDARAFRLAGLSGVDAFEVDHPATQAYKRTRTKGRVPCSRSLHFVAVDFERDHLHEQLVAAGHDPARRSAWIWEGVIMYLSDSALRATLESIAALSAAGSTLMVQYREPPAAEDRMERRMRAVQRRRGEPQIGLRTRTTMRVELERVGFHVILDEGADDWAARFGASPPLSIARPARLLLSTIQ